MDKKNNAGNLTDEQVFQVFIPEKKTAILLDQKVDVTIIPAKTAFKFVIFNKKHKGINLKNDNTGIDENILDEILDIVEEITTRSNPVVTKEWLLNNLSIQDIVRFITFIFKSLQTKKVEAAGDSKGGTDGKNQ